MRPNILIARWFFPSVVVLLASAAAAWAGDTPGGQGASEAVFIIQLVVLMLVGRLLGEALLRLRQPAVMGQLMAGLVLGPSLLRSEERRGGKGCGRGGRP